MFKRHVRSSGVVSTFAWIIAGGLTALFVSVGGAAAGGDYGTMIRLTQ